MTNRNHYNRVEELIKCNMYELEGVDMPYAIGLKAIDVFSFVKTYKAICTQAFGKCFNNKHLNEYTIGLDDEVVNVSHFDKLVSLKTNNISELILKAFKDMYVVFCAVPAVEYVKSKWEYFSSFDSGVGSIGCFSINISTTHIRIRFNGNTGLASPKFQEYSYPWSCYMSLGKPIFENTNN